MKKLNSSVMTEKEKRVIEFTIELNECTNNNFDQLEKDACF